VNIGNADLAEKCSVAW